MVSQIKLHGPSEQQKPFWVPRGNTLQKAYLEEWEQLDHDQSNIRSEQSKNRHRSCSVSRTATSESSQTVKDDTWSATRELPAPRLPQSSRKPFSWLCVSTTLHRVTLHVTRHLLICLATLKRIKLHGQSSSLKRSSAELLCHVASHWTLCATRTYSKPSPSRPLWSRVQSLRSAWREGVRAHGLQHLRGAWCCLIQDFSGMLSAESQCKA